MAVKKICIVGMGYVGLTLACVLADKGFKVYGFEIKKEVVDNLNQGLPHFHEKGLDVLLKKHLKKNLIIGDTLPEESQDVFVISVGTPIDKQTRKPILDYVKNAASQVASVMADETLIILRSTVPVGVTRKTVKPVLDQSQKKYYLAFCPERTIEGKALKELTELPQIIGGLDEGSVEKALDVFRKLTYSTIEVTSLEAAEMIKLLNNSYRDLNFAFANEIALVCEKAGLNAPEVIKAANLGYERSKIPVPGFVGGACLEKDPPILADFAQNIGYEPKLVKAGRAVNESLPKHVAARIVSLLKEKDSSTAKVFITGFAFKGKPETDDLRGSLTLTLVAELKKLGITNIHGHDFVVKHDDVGKTGVKAVTMEEGFKDADAVIIANNHHSYEGLPIETLLSTTKKPCTFMDCWAVFESDRIKSVDGITYGGIGF